MTPRELFLVTLDGFCTLKITEKRDIFRELYMWDSYILQIYHQIGNDYNWKSGDFNFAFAFAMERQINSLRLSFTFAFIMTMLGTHKPQQQATLTSPRFSFAFAFVIQLREKILNPVIYYVSLVIVSVRMGFSIPPPTPFFGLRNLFRKNIRKSYCNCNSNSNSNDFEKKTVMQL